MSLALLFGNFLRSYSKDLFNFILKGGHDFDPVVHI